MTAASKKRDEAARLAADSIERFRDAAERERQSRDASPEEHLRVLEETIEEERQAIEEFGEAVTLQRQAVKEQATELAALHPPKTKGDAKPKRAKTGGKKIGGKK